MYLWKRSLKVTPINCWKYIVLYKSIVDTCFSYVPICYPTFWLLYFVHTSFVVNYSHLIPPSSDIFYIPTFLWWPLLLCSAYTRLVQGQLKAFYHLHFFFLRLSRDWYGANPKRLIIWAPITFYFIFMTFLRHTFFLLFGSYSFRLERACFFKFILLSRACFFTPLHYLEAFNHLSFLILASLVQPRPLSTFHPWAVWHKASVQRGVTFSESTAGSFVPNQVEHLCLSHVPDTH